MEMVLVLLSLPLIALFSFLASLLFNRRRNRNTPPGSLGWPIIGEYIPLLREPEKFVQERMKKYNPHVFKTSFLTNPLLVFCGPKANKFLYSNENKLVVTWWPTSVQKLAPLAVLNTVGSKCKQTRRQLMNFLNPETLQRQVGLMDAIAQRHLQEEWEGNDQVKALQLIKNYTFSLACRMLTGVQDPDQMSWLLARFKVFQAGLFDMPLNFPGMKFYSAMRAAEELREELRKIIKEKREVFSEDLVSYLLVAEDEKGQLMAEKEILDNFLMLFVDAHDTAARAIAIVMKHLAETPHIYSNVLKEQQEIAMLKKPSELLDLEDIRKMKYSSNVMHEAFRLSPPIHGSFRKAIEDFTFEGFDIPKGSMMLWTAYSTHKNPEYFPEPEKFDPSRFEGDGPAPYTFVPFGGGLRICPGRDFGKLQILVFLHNVVKRFRWELLCPNEKIVVDPMPTPTKGLPLHLQPHHSY